MNRLAYALPCCPDLPELLQSTKEGITADSMGGVN